MNSYTFRKLSIGWFFTLEGVLVGSFNACSAIFKEMNGFSDEMYGFILFLCVLTGIASVPVAAKSCDMTGSAKTTIISGATCVLVTPVMALVSGQGHFTLLLIMVILFGFTLAILDVGVNAQACVYEKLTKASHMGFMHAAYAVGAILGSLWAGVLIHRQVTFFNVLLIISLGSGLLSVPFLRSMVMKDEEDQLNSEASSKSRTGDTNTESSSTDYAKLSKAAMNMLYKPFANVENSPSIFPRKNKRHDVQMQVLSSQIDGSSTAAETALRMGLIEEKDSYEFCLTEEEEDQDEEEEIVFHGPRSNSSNHKLTSEHAMAEYSLLVVLIAILSVGYLVEGAIGDWSAVFLVEDCKVPPSSGWNVLGYSFFNVFVVISRIMSDVFVSDIGRATILQYSSVLSCFGLILIATAP